MDELTTLLECAPPPFVYVHAPSSLNPLVQSLSSMPSVAHVNAQTSFTPRILFSSILSQLRLPLSSSPSLDSFIHAISSNPLKSQILVSKPEKLKPELFIPFTRLPELTGNPDISVIFASRFSWEHIRVLGGGCPDPYFIDVPAFSRSERMLLSGYTEPAELRPLYIHFVDFLLSAVLSSLSSPSSDTLTQLQKISARTWPVFLEPLLEVDRYGEHFDGILDNPGEEERLRMLKRILPHIQAASSSYAGEKENRLHLPKLQKYLLIASYIASTNPPKSDLRMFGRGVDERKRKRRSPSKRRAVNGKTSTGKMPKEYLGPGAFGIERLLAILGALLEDNEETEERQDGEESRVWVLQSIAELCTIRLITQEGNSGEKFKCGVTYEQALSFAKDVGVQLDGLLWDPPV